MKATVKKITNIMFLVLIIPAILLVSFSCAYMAVDFNYANATGMFGTFTVADEDGEDIGYFKSGEDFAVGDSVAFYVDSAAASDISRVWSPFDGVTEEVKEVSIGNFIVVDTVSAVSGNAVTTSSGYTTTTDLVLGTVTESAGIAGVFGGDNLATWTWVLLVLMGGLIWIDLLFKDSSSEEKTAKEKAKQDAAAAKKAEKEKEAAEKQPAKKQKKKRQQKKLKEIKLQQQMQQLQQRQQRKKLTKT